MVIVVIIRQVCEHEAPFHCNFPREMIIPLSPFSLCLENDGGNLQRKNGNAGSNNEADEAGRDIGHTSVRARRWLSAVGAVLGRWWWRWRSNSGLWWWRRWRRRSVVVVVRLGGRRPGGGVVGGMGVRGPRGVGAHMRVRPGFGLGVVRSGRRSLGGGAAGGGGFPPGGRRRVAVLVIIGVGDAELRAVLVLAGRIVDQLDSVAGLAGCEVRGGNPDEGAVVGNLLGDRVLGNGIGAGALKQEERDGALGRGSPGDGEVLANGNDGVHVRFMDGIALRQVNSCELDSERKRSVGHRIP